MPRSQDPAPPALPSNRFGPSVFDLQEFSKFTAHVLNSRLTSSPNQLGLCHECAHTERGPCHLDFKGYVRDLLIASNTSVAVGIGSHVLLAYFFGCLSRSLTSICSVHFLFTISLMISQQMFGYDVLTVWQWEVLTRDTFRASELRTHTLVVSKLFGSTPEIPRDELVEMSRLLHVSLSITQPIEWMSLWTVFEPSEYLPQSILGCPLSRDMLSLPSVISSVYPPLHVSTCLFLDFSRVGPEEPGDSSLATLFGKRAMRDEGDAPFIEEVARSLYNCNIQLSSSFNLSNKLGKEVNSQPSGATNPPAFVASGSSFNHIVNPRPQRHVTHSASDSLPQHAVTPFCVPFSRSPSYPIGTPRPFTPWDPNMQTAPTPVCQEPTLIQDPSFSGTVPSPSIAQYPTFRGHPSMSPI